MGNASGGGEEISESTLHLAHYEMIWCGVMLSLTFPDREKEDNTQDNDNNGDDCESNKVKGDGEKGMVNDSNHAYDDADTDTDTDTDNDD